MKLRKAVVSLSITAAMAASLLAGCGSSSNSAASSGNTASAEKSTTNSSSSKNTETDSSTVSNNSSSETVIASSTSGDADEIVQPDDYPKKNISVIVPYSAGGPTDMSVRALLDTATDYLPSGVSFMPENRTGSGGLVGMAATAASKADGYTLGPIAVDITMLNHEGKTDLTVNDFTPLAATMADPYGIVVNASSNKFSDIESFVQYAKDHPGEVTVGNSGVGTATHLSAIALEKAVGVKFNHVAYDGSADAIAALAGGHIDATFCQMQPAKAQIDAGVLKMIGIMSDERMKSYPDIPTVNEICGTDFKVRGWVVVCAPAGLDKEKTNYLTSIFKKAVSTEEYKEAIRNLGMEPVEITGDELIKMIQDDDAFYADLTKDIDLS